jgi:hypothetical protein
MKVEAHVKTTIVGQTFVSVEGQFRVQALACSATAT